MGVMEKMRNSTASILWVLIFSFGLLWVLADTQVFDALAVGPQNLGSVNGDEITMEEYNNRVNNYTQQFNQQNGGNLTSEIRSMYEQQAWDDLVAARLLQQKMDELGISVTDNELVEMVTGENPDPFIRQQFQDENGNIDRIALQAAIESPENSEIWVLIEQQLRENRRQQKMNNFIAAGFRVSPLDIKNQFIADNSYADIRYVRFPYGDIGNDEISISDDELEEYHSSHSSQFQRSESYRFRYVQWDKTPTAEDTLGTTREIENLRQAFESAEDDSMFIERYQSTTSYRGQYVSREEIPEEHATVLDLEVGEVSEVIMVNSDPYAFKKIDERNDEILYAVLSYTVQADPVGTIDRLAEEADEFKFYADEDGFESEAETRNLEIGEASATKDNPVIPGLGRSQQALMVLEGLSRNEISEPIEMNNQFIVVQLLERTPEGVRPLSEVRTQVENSVRNQKRRTMMIERVESMLNESEDLEALATNAETEVQVAENIRFGSSLISGAGREPRVVGAIFEMEPGQQSGVVTGENAAFVLVVDNLEMADPSEMTAEDRIVIERRLEQEKVNAFNQVFIEQMKKDADITDNRRQLLQ